MAGLLCLWHTGEEIPLWILSHSQGWKEKQCSKGSVCAQCAETLRWLFSLVPLLAQYFIAKFKFYYHCLVSKGRIYIRYPELEK